MRRGHIAALVAVVLVAGCGSKPSTVVAPTHPATTPASVSTAAPTTAVTAAPTTVAPTTTTAAVNSVGSTALDTDGTKITLHAVSFPAVPSSTFLKPAAGDVLWAGDIELCAGSKGTSYNPLYFELQMPDNTRATGPSLASKEPALHSGELSANDCIRGWVNFDVASGSHPTYLLHTVPLGAISIKWKLP